MQTKPILLMGSVGLLVTAAVVIAQAAPTPGEASLTVDQQIHLGTDSALVKEGSLLFWEASTNTGMGRNALSSNTTGSSNTATGFEALLKNEDGKGNTAMGYRALYKNLGGDHNTAIGYWALLDQTTGTFNTGIGYGALAYNETGTHNIAVGEAAGMYSDGSSNIWIANYGEPGVSNTMRIGEGTGTPALHLNRVFIAGIQGITTGQNDAITVMIDSKGQLGTTSSSRRHKEDIADMEEASERLMNLRPVTFRFKEPFKNSEKPIQFGLVAEEVAAVFPELVVYNEEGLPETVKYHLLSTLLLNELQEQHDQNLMQWGLMGLMLLVGAAVTVRHVRFG